MNALTLLIGGLAVWRLSHAIVKEDGPIMIFVRFRAFLARTQKRSGGFFDLISCVYCISFWTGLVASLFVAYDIFTWIGYGLAFSGIASLLEAFFLKQTNSLVSVTRPATDDKVSISTRTAPKKRGNVVGYPYTLDPKPAIKASSPLSN